MTRQIQRITVETREEALGAVRTMGAGTIVTTARPATKSPAAAVAAPPAVATRPAPVREPEPSATADDHAADVLALVYRAGLKGFEPPAESAAPKPEDGDAADVLALARAVGLKRF